MNKLCSAILFAAVALASHALAQTLSLTRTFPNPTPANSDQFGNAVAAVGNKILVGARNDDAGASNAGAVYLFDSASSTPVLSILNPTPATNDLFGAAVASFGNDLLVGAPGANAASGEVYFFDGATGALILTIANPNSSNDQFGFAVTVVGNNILVGAPFNDTGAPDAGIAYLFDSNGTLLRTFANPTPLPSTGVADQFGSSLAAVGNNVLIGAPNDDTGATNAGAAYLFDGNTGTLLRTFTNPSPTLSDQFGGAVAAVGSNVLIGTAFEDAPVSNSGVAYLFDVNIGPPIQTFQNPTPGSTDLFSFSVAAFGNTVLVVIGAPLDDAGASNAGASYLYDVTVTSPLQTFLNPAPVGGDQFGLAIAAGGNNIIIAAPFNDTGAADAGTVYLYSSNASPVADAGADQTIECTSSSGALAMLDGSGSTDPNSDQLTYTWRENGSIIAGPTTSPTSPVTLGLGSHTIELTVDDGNDETDTDEVVINVVDTAPPTITLNGDNPMALECSTPYVEPGAVANDASDPSPTLAISGSVNASAPGTYTITYTATDAHNNSASATRTVNVVDTTPPVIALKPATELWPPNHQYVSISAAQCVATVSDDCAGNIPLGEVKIVSVSSDEPDDSSGDFCINLGLLHICLSGDGATTNDMVIADDCRSAMLRAERSIGGNGRVYTINLQVSDPSGNVATAAYKVSVPHDQCGNNTAVDNGPTHTVFGNCSGAALAKAGDAQNLDVDATLLPESYDLAQNFPNPFNPETEIRFQLPEAGHAVLTIFNTLGENIRTVADGGFAAGTHAVRWNAQNDRGEKVSSGVYFYRLVTPNFTATKRMFLAK